jgi:hypothetical protein
VCCFACATATTPPSISSALERYFARHSGEPPFRASQIVRLAGKTKKLVFAQGGIGIGVAVGLGGTKRGARSLPNHASSAGFASRLDELRARLVCASLPPLAAELLDDELFDVGAPSADAASAAPRARRPPMPTTTTPPPRCPAPHRLARHSAAAADAALGAPPDRDVLEAAAQEGRQPQARASARHTRRPVRATS